jgi:hypothetical protein
MMVSFSPSALCIYFRGNPSTPSSCNPFAESGVSKPTTGRTLRPLMPTDVTAAESSKGTVRIKAGQSEPFADSSG